MATALKGGAVHATTNLHIDCRTITCWASPRTSFSLVRGERRQLASCH